MSKVAISFASAPRRDVVELALCAEELGYERVWIYDSPAVYGDVWIALARIAERTRRIGLGTGVAVTHLRHVMVTASAIADIEELAPGRLACAFGTGFSARLAMGQKPLRWSLVKQYVQQLRGLLRGETVEIDGIPCRMLHSPGFALPRPINVPLLLAPAGPKGLAVAREIGDGIVVADAPRQGFGSCTLMVFGTVLDPGEHHTSPHVRDAVGPTAVTMYHGALASGRETVDALPGGREWRLRVEAELPERQRHFVHEGHLVAVTDRDRSLLDSAGPFLANMRWIGTAETIRARIAEAAAAGTTGIMYAPAGSDIPRELRAFARAAGV